MPPKKKTKKPQLAGLNSFTPFALLVSVRGGGGGGRAVAQSVERATPGEVVRGSIPAPLLTGWVGVSIM